MAKTNHLKLAAVLVAGYVAANLLTDKVMVIPDAQANRDPIGEANGRLSFPDVYVIPQDKLKEPIEYK